MFLDQAIGGLLALGVGMDGGGARGEMAQVGDGVVSVQVLAIEHYHQSGAAGVSSIEYDQLLMIRAVRSSVDMAGLVVGQVT